MFNSRERERERKRQRERERERALKTCKRMADDAAVAFVLANLMAIKSDGNQVGWQSMLMMAIHAYVASKLAG